MMTAQLEETTVDETFAQDPKKWFQAQASEDMPYLLAYADDGVIWGCLTGTGEFALSGDAFTKVGVKLRASTLQQARLFGPAGELFLWRTTGQDFSYRIIKDRGEKSDDALEDTYWLWGTGKRANGEFTLMEEGRQGLYHAPPLNEAQRKRGGLQVRHYVDYDEETGQAYISHSRLVDLHAQEVQDGD